NGSWVRVGLNGLPPGEPWLGMVIRDGASNIVATLPVQSPLIYDRVMTTGQLEGPPDDDPPASPGSKKEFKGHVTLMKAFDDGDDSGGSAARGHTKSGHVTLMKAFDDGEESGSTAARGHTKSGHVTLMKAYDDGDSSGMARLGTSEKKEF